MLFNDLFLCVKPKKKAGAGYYDPIVLSLQVAKFIEISDTEGIERYASCGSVQWRTINACKLYAEVRNSFELQAEGERGETKSVVLVLPSPELKAEWSKEIKKIIRSYQKQRLLAAKKGTFFFPSLSSSTSLCLVLMLFVVQIQERRTATRSGFPEGARHPRP